MSKRALGLVVCLHLACAAPRTAAEGAATPTALQRLPESVRIVDQFVSSYLIVLGTEAILVDCGLDPTGAPILAALDQRGLPRTAVKAIFLTHAHADHIGGCHLFPSAPIHAFVRPEDVASASPSIRAKSHLLNDGATVTVGPHTVRAYAVPGHTADSGAFLIGDVLYLGDGATSDGTKLKASPWIFSGEAKQRDDEKKNVAALARLHTRLVADNAKVASLAFAHSPPALDRDALTRAE